MSTFGRPLTDDGLIRVLDHWLDDGPVVAPDLMVESALRTAARTPQRRWRGRVLRFTGGSPLVPVGLTLAAVAAVVALGAGLGQVLPLPGTEATPTPGVTDLPTPDASSLPSGLVMYTNEEDGYKLLLPAGLAADARQVPGRGEPWAGVRGFGHGQRWLYAVAISIGQPDGSITLCGIIRESPITTACHSVTVTSLDDLEEALISTADASLRDREYHGDVSLGGLPARVEAIRLGGLVLGPTAIHHVYAMHEGRPIVLSFDEYTLKQMGDSTRDAILESFRLLESDVEAEASPAPAPRASEWRVATDVAHGYALEVPAGWEDRECCSPGGRTLYAGEATPVMIMAGDADGRITICQRGDCVEIMATQLSDLRHAVRAVAPMDAASWRHTLRHDALTLGGEPAEREWPDSIFGAGPEPIYDWVYAIHDGRPIVLRFNHFRGKLNPSEQQRIIESFDFLD